MNHNPNEAARPLVADDVPGTKHDISAFIPEAQPVQQSPSLSATLARHRNTEGMDPNSLILIKEAEDRGIPWRRMDENSKIMFGYGKNQQVIRGTLTSKTSGIALETANDRYNTKMLLYRAGVEVPEGELCSSVEEVRESIEQLGYPIVIKPRKRKPGFGIPINITNLEAAEEAFAYAQTFGPETVVEKFIEGENHRMLVINGKLVAAVRLATTSVTVKNEQMPNETNQNPGPCDTREAIDVTDDIHPANRFMAERIAALMGLGICGIQVIAPGLITPVAQNGGAVIAVNAAPDFQMYVTASRGKPQNVASAVIDMLYPPPLQGRIPIFAVTGTNGKTTTTRLLAHLVQSFGHFPGYTTTDGVYIGGHQVEGGDCSGPSSATMVLADPMVDFAVLETARGGLLRAGLAFDYCDVAIITNIASDHLGMKNINTLEELAEVKAAVVRSVKKTGHAVLNAEDPHCVAISRTLDCTVVFFALDGTNEVVQEHIFKGGLAVTAENGNIIIHQGTQRTVLATLKDIPLTFGGTSKSMTANILAATAACFAYGFAPAQINNGLRTFLPGPELTPGRMNLFYVRDFTVLVDYAHNAHGLRAMQDYLSHIKAPRKIGIIAGVGDRRDSDIIELAEIAGNIFDHIIVRQEYSLRGRSVGEMQELTVTGIQQANRPVEYEFIADEKAAIRHALATAKTGDYIVALSVNYREVIGIIEEFQNRT